MYLYCRSREGAWIEMYIIYYDGRQTTVAPARERGLKCTEDDEVDIDTICRSREGAWIEIFLSHNSSITIMRRSREGAWIEIQVAHILLPSFYVAPARERGLKWERKVILP